MADKREKNEQAWGRCETAGTRPTTGGPVGARAAASGGRAAGRCESPEPLGNAIYAGSLCRLFFEESEPLRALSAALRLYLRSYMNGARARITVIGPDRAEVRLLGGGDSSRPSCQSTLAYLRDAVHLATGTRVEAREERCVHRGDPACVLQIHWGPVDA